MFTVYKSDDFADWLTALTASKAKAVIIARIRRLELGNLGDWKSVGDGIAEMRIDHGPGYRLYFFKDGKTVYVLLCGGQKKTQKRDIGRAKVLVKKWKAQNS